MWNSIPLAPQEHTPALTLGASQLTLVHARGVGSLKRLNLHNHAVHLNAVSDLNSQDAGLSTTGHVFELRRAVQEP